MAVTLIAYSFSMTKVTPTIRVSFLLKKLKRDMGLDNGLINICIMSLGQKEEKKIF